MKLFQSLQSLQYPQYRGKGIGTALMRKMLEHLRVNGYSQTSLAVQKDNYAVKMYQRVDFAICDENEQEYIMICKLTDYAKRVFNEKILLVHGE